MTVSSNAAIRRIAQAFALCAALVAPMRATAQQPNEPWKAGLPQTSGLRWPWTQTQQPHPSVCRVIVPEKDSIALGSGTLIDARDKFGLVLTNWHVVSDATGTITVVFPDGFRSAAQVAKVDKDWDLAALAIWKPNAQPVALAAQAPQPGELLSIAGYGSGDYRSVSGRCTQYVAPSAQAPFEMIELAASARQGDSGGPIFNTRGEVAGVLFGAGGGFTSGSYCGRVRWFLTDVLPELRGSPEMIAAATPTGAGGYPSTSEKLAIGSVSNSGWRAVDRNPTVEHLPPIDGNDSFAGGERVASTNVGAGEPPPHGQSIVEKPVPLTAQILATAAAVAPENPEPPPAASQVSPVEPIERANAPIAEPVAQALPTAAPKPAPGPAPAAKIENNKPATPPPAESAPRAAVLNTAAANTAGEPVVADAPAKAFGMNDIVGTTATERIKTGFAMLGLLTLLMNLKQRFAARRAAAAEAVLFEQPVPVRKATRPIVRSAVRDRNAAA